MLTHKLIFYSYKLVPLVHMAEMEALLPCFDQLDSAINSGPEHWDDPQAEEAQLLLEKTDELLQRMLVYAASPEMAQGLQLLEAAVTDENTRWAIKQEGRRFSHKPIICSPDRCRQVKYWRRQSSRAVYVVILVVNVFRGDVCAGMGW